MVEFEMNVVGQKYMKQHFLYKNIVLHSKKDLYSLKECLGATVSHLES